MAPLCLDDDNTSSTASRTIQKFEMKIILKGEGPVAAHRQHGGQETKERDHDQRRVT